MRACQPNEYTFKAVRAGQATEAAGRGMSLPEILFNGGWRNPRSVPSYVDADKADSMAHSMQPDEDDVELVRKAVDESSSSEEEG